MNDRMWTSNDSKGTIRSVSTEMMCDWTIQAWNMLLMNSQEELFKTGITNTLKESENILEVSTAMNQHHREDLGMKIYKPTVIKILCIIQILTFIPYSQLVL
jgi:hypothetical protein